MKQWLTVLAIFAAACSAPTDSATSSNPPAKQSPWGSTIEAAGTGTPAAAAPGSTNAAARNGPVAAAPDAAPAKVVPTIPQGARFTIFCESFSGPDHVARSTEMKNILVSKAKSKDWYVIHQEGQSTIYHGYYRDFDVNAAADAAGKKDAQRAQNDKRTVDSLPNPYNETQKLFARALFVSLDSPDPDAPAEWSLVNTRGHWSVQIAAYTGFDRKAAAVDSVREARKLNIPAYYYHGPSYSSVCIGAWPASAVREQATEQVNSINANDSVFVDVRGGSIPNEVRQGMLRDGKRVQVVVPKIEILDKSLLDTLSKYPEHHVDGYIDVEQVVDPVSKKKSDKPKHSMLVRIPASDATAQGTDTSLPEPTLIQPTSPSNLGARLRGLNQ